MKRQIIIGPDTKIARLGGSPPRAVLTLLLVQIGLFLVYAFTDGPKWVDRHFAASAGRCLGHFELWQPLTALWIHLGTRGLLLNALTLWVFGSTLERWWGAKRFVVFWVVTGVVGLAVGVLAGLLKRDAVLYGSGGSAVAMLVATALIFADHLVFFYGLLNLKVWVMCLILGGFILLGDIIDGAWLELAVQLGGGVTALLFLFRRGERIGQRRGERSRRTFQVIEGGKQKDQRKGEKKYWN